MKIGLLLPNGGGASGAASVRGCFEIAQAAETLGYDSVWLGDRLLVPASLTRRPGAAGDLVPQSEEVLEPLVMLCALAQRSERIRLGICSLVIPYRYPLVTAKMLSTADHLAGGRLILGAVAGWAQAEFAALGLTDEHYRCRGSVTADYLRAIKEAWLSTGPSWYVGEHVTFRNVGTYPHPLQQPHIPIWLGGSTAAALRRAVRLGDGFIAPSGGPDELQATVARLQQLAQKDRRDPEELTVAMMVEVVISERGGEAPAGTMRGTAEQIAERLRSYEQAGLQYLIAAVHGEEAGSLPAALATVEAFAERALPAPRAGAAV